MRDEPDGAGAPIRPWIRIDKRPMVASNKIPGLHPHPNEKTQGLRVPSTLVKRVAQRKGGLDRLKLGLRPRNVEGIAFAAHLNSFLRAFR